jgi:hypothetical protein
MGLVTLRILLLPCVLFAGAWVPSAAAQSAPASSLVSPAASAVPAARPADVSSMDAIIKAVYDVISGSADQQRDWNRMRSLFVPGARLIAVHASKDSPNVARVLSVEDYIRRAEPLMAKKGFFERESHRTVERFGDIAQVFSTYESRYVATDAKPFERGINSFQLMFDGQRWWVVTIYWQGERPDRPIPKQYGG